MTDELLALARDGDEQAFRELTDPFRRQLLSHCYRILGSTQDAEDALQETMVAAWRKLEQLDHVQALRSWLHRIATNLCLNMLRAGKRRPEQVPARPTSLPEPTRVGEITWLEPYPDDLLDPPDAHALDPAVRVEAKESMSLAFVAALQVLPPRQRAALLLADVLGYRVREIAEMLDSSEESIQSAIRRARATLEERVPANARTELTLPDAHSERELITRFADAFERGDVPELVTLLTDDVLLTMPPLPIEYQGRETAANFLETVAFGGGTRTYRLIPTRANGQPAFGCYQRDRQCPIARAHGLLVLTLAGDRISVITRFLDNSLLPRFGLPRTLDD
jgi:RNA polymerase sigma-70 factor (TIGR02960 family)